MINVTSRAALFIIAGLVALAPLSTDMYLPSLPAMRVEFGASVDQIQLTLSLFLVFFGLTQLICGPLADRFGRKPIIAIGMVIFVAASLGCAQATSITEMIFFRCLQAMGACVGPVLGRTIVRDVHGPLRAASVLAYVAGIMALAPAVAPIIGGGLLNFFSWPAIFIALGSYCALVGMIYLGRFPETLPPEYKQPMHLLAILKNFLLLMKDRIYMAYILCGALTYAGLFVFISGAPFVLIEHFGVPETQFGYYFFVIVIGYIGGSFISGRLSRSVRSVVLLRSGVLCGLSVGLLSMALHGLEIRGLVYVVLPMMFYAMGAGLIMPQVMAGALKHYPHMAGTASALMGFTQQLIAASAGILFGVLHQQDEWMMILLIACYAVACTCCYFFLLPLREKQS